MDRRPDAADAGLVLAFVDGIAAGTDQFQLTLELSPVGDGSVSEALQSAGDDGVDPRGWLEGQDCFADAGAMDGCRLDQGQRRAAVGRYAMDDDRLLSIEDRQVDQVAADLAQRIDDRASLARSFLTCFAAR